MYMMSYYLDSLHKTIQAQVDLLEAYKKRIEFAKIKQLDSSLNDELKNEATITILTTLAEVETLENVIAEKRRYFDNYAKHFEKDLADTNANWDKLIAKTKVVVKLKPQLQQFIDAIDKIENIDEDLDKKVFIYKRLKSVLNG